MTDEILSKTFLFEKLNSIKQFISKREFRYYHIDSIDNFIFHIDKFNSERTSVRMAHQIDEYLTLLNQKLNEPHDKHELAMELFPHIWKIADTYKYELGFRHSTPFWMIIAIWTVVFFIVNATGPAWMAIIAAVVGAIVHAIWVYTKKKTRRFF